MELIGHEQVSYGLHKKLVESKKNCMRDLFEVTHYSKKSSLTIAFDLPKGEEILNVVKKIVNDPESTFFKQFKEWLYYKSGADTHSSIMNNAQLDAVKILHKTLRDQEIDRMKYIEKNYLEKDLSPFMWKILRCKEGSGADYLFILCKEGEITYGLSV